MNVNFILVGGISKQAEENYKNLNNNNYNKDFVAKCMENGDYATASENLFNNNVFKEIFKGPLKTAPI